MNNLEKEHIKIFREYFLASNEDSRRNIRGVLSAVLLKYLSIIENGFSQKVAVENIALQIDATHLIADLKQLQADYYSLLEQVFENEVVFAIKATERAAFKKKFETIDLEEDFQLHDAEIKSAITQVERELIKQKLENIDEETEIKQRPVASIVSFNRIIKFAAAACVIGIVILGGYLIINNGKEQKNNSLASNEDSKDSVKTEIAANLPTIIEHVSEKPLLFPESFGFAKEKSKIFIVIIQNIGKQIDTLKKIYSNELQGRNGIGYGPTAKAMSQQIDSLMRIRNSYTYNIVNNKIVVKLDSDQTVGEVITTDPSQNDKLFIKINNDYYQLKPTSIPVKLIPVKNENTIDELEKIVFQNS